MIIYAIINQGETVMERYEVNKYLTEFKAKIANLKISIKFDEIKNQVNLLDQEQLSDTFWNNPNEARETIEKTNELREKITNISYFENTLSSITELYKALEDDELEMLSSDIYELDKKIKKFEVITLFKGPYDLNDCYLEIHPGAGGTESQDWGSMLYRMYLRYANRKNYKVEVIDYQVGEEAGLKSATLKIKGKYAFGNLKGEMGVHRLVRISPFDSNKRRHTSFVSIEVIPEIKDQNELVLNEDDLKIDVYRSGGAGGQSVNTTDSAVRITHLPTGIVVTCQNERSQIKNKETALNLLKTKLIQLKLKEQEDKLKELKGEQKEIGWGSQIRSYVLHPYQMVKDHRTNVETSQTDSVMDGDIELFINSYLRSSYGSN